MLAGVQLCRQSCVRPALANLGRRKPRGWLRPMGKERRRARLTLPRAVGRLCLMGFLQSFSAIVVACILPIER
jgi:hypothetical protein